jgi:hypothetical protein
MDVREMLANTGGLRSIASELGLSEQDAANGAEALAPAVLDGFERKAPSDDEGGLSALLNRLGGGDLLDNVTSPQPTDVNRGNNVLASIFGSKDVSRGVAREASGRTGLDTGVLKKMLPMVAMMVAGHMAKAGGRNVLGSLLQRMGRR